MKNKNYIVRVWKTSKQKWPAEHYFETKEEAEEYYNKRFNKYKEVSYKPWDELELKELSTGKIISNTKWN